MRAQFRFGIDLGGTKTEIIALEGSDERLRRRLPTPQDGSDPSWGPVLP